MLVGVLLNLDADLAKGDDSRVRLLTMICVLIVVKKNEKSWGSGLLNDRECT